MEPTPWEVRLVTAGTEWALTGCQAMLAPLLINPHPSELSAIMSHLTDEETETDEILCPRSSSEKAEAGTRGHIETARSPEPFPNIKDVNPNVRLSTNGRISVTTVDSR